MSRRSSLPLTYDFIVVLALGSCGALQGCGDSGSSGVQGGVDAGGGDHDSGATADARSGAHDSGSMTDARSGEADARSGTDGSAEDGNADGATTGRVPVNNRPTDTACPAGRAPGALPSADCNYDASPPACLHDSDCTMGTNGRCEHSDLIPAVCVVACSYDACSTDSDCPSKEPCSCRSSATSNAANVCLTGSDCRVNADCGSGGYCSPSAGYGSYGCGVAYFCHTAADTCVDDTDCESQQCQYDDTAGHWRCGVHASRVVPATGSGASSAPLTLPPPWGGLGEDQ